MTIDDKSLVIVSSCKQPRPVPCRVNRCAKQNASHSKVENFVKKSLPDVVAKAYLLSWATYNPINRGKLRTIHLYELG